jgi:hypothetical protein
MRTQLHLDLSSDDDARLKRILSQPTLDGIIITNEQGQFQYTTLDNNLTFLITSKLLAFVELAQSIVRDLHPTDSLVTCRLRTREKEMVIVTPVDAMKIIAIQKIPTASLSTTAKNNDNEFHENF